MHNCIIYWDNVNIIYFLLGCKDAYVFLLKVWEMKVSIKQFDTITLKIL